MTAIQTSIISHYIHLKNLKFEFERLVSVILNERNIDTNFLKQHGFPDDVQKFPEPN
jgi:hypothetical protein